MNGKTHQAGGKLAQTSFRMPVSIAYMLIKPNALETLLVYMFYNAITRDAVVLGAAIQDYDQTSYDNSPKVMKHSVGMAYHKFLKLIGATHRSTHTHNLDIWFLLVGVPTFTCLGMFILTKRLFWFLVSMWLFGLFIGILSHQFLDTLTVAGTNQSHLMAVVRRGKSKNKRAFDDLQKVKARRIVPINRHMYSMKPVYWGRLRTPIPKISKASFNVGTWGRTGGGWENQIQAMMLGAVESMNTIPRRTLELLILYLIFSAI